MQTKIIEFEKGIEEAIDVLRGGGVIACATDTVYGLSCDPFSESGIDAIYNLKNRERNVPLLLIAHENFDISSLVVFDALAEKYTKKYWPGSVTFIFKIKDERLRTLSCGKDTIAIRKPDNQKLNLLLERFPLLTSTSANISKCPVATDAQEVIKYFNEKISLVLDNGKCGDISSTIVDLSTSEVKILREGKIKIKDNL